MNNRIRITSLDALRGITLALMILVNNPGDWGNIYYPLQHADWNGCSFADLVFPFFIFTMGVSFTISTSQRLMSQTRNKLLLHIFYRSVILFLLGLFLNALPDLDLSSIRILGVLQRLAIVYLLSSVLYLYTKPKQLFNLLLLFLIGYWFLFTQVNVPDLGFPSLEKEKNIAAYIDRLVLKNHLWKHSKTWDPEGIVTTFGAVCTMIIGMFIGSILLDQKTDNTAHSYRLLFLSIWGMVCIISGMLWDSYFPINKNLWTSSYVLFTAGLAMICFACFYFLMEVKQLSFVGSPFEIYGTNSLAVFFFSALLAKTFNIIRVGNQSLKEYLMEILLTPYFSSYNASLAWAVLHLLFWFLVLLFLYKKKIYIKL
ncbi:MAG: DUF1624 domain-containing protein [Leptospiraceae bacterium]|nr:DUF1624 domain-containing protein [Leptospiraceae bacterium]MCP5493886.1 DUF1624 domain-containing protein [Leptospiraceae bacterium]